MVMYGNLIDFFPNFFYTKENIKEIANIIKPGQKLRLVNGFLQVDNRRFQCIQRKITNDSRLKISDKLLYLLENYKNDFYIKKIIITLKETYKNDKKWCEKFQNIIEDNEFFIINQSLIDSLLLN